MTDDSSGFPAALPVVLAGLCAPAYAQDPPLHASLLGSYKVQESTYADVWSDGNYAYVGRLGQNGVDIIDISDPTNPFLAANFKVPPPDDAASTQDVKVGDGLLFVALAGDLPNGALIVDVRNPLNPTALTTVTPEPGSYAKVHNLFYDQGWLYLAGFASNTLAIVDLRNYDPDNPPAAINTWDYELTGVGNAKVHDVTVQGGRLYVSAWDGLYIYDVSALGTQAPVLLGSVRGISTHSAWPTEDGAFVITAEERPGGGLRLYEIDESTGTMVLHPRDSYAAPRSAAPSPHNPVVLADRIYASYYQAGLLVLELDRASKTMELVASFDTTALPPINIAGGFGVYPFLGANEVLLSDTDEGLLVLDTSALHFSFPAGRPLTVAPNAATTLSIDLVQHGTSVVDPATLALHTRIDQGAETVSPLISLGSGRYEATFPPAPCGGSVDYWLSGVDLAGRSFTDPIDAPLTTYSVEVATGLTPVFQDDFVTDKGWTVSDTALTSGSWTRVDPIGTGAQPRAASPEALDPICYVTGQGSPNGADSEADVDGGPTTLTSPRLSFGADGLIRFSTWFFNSDGDGDQLEIQLSGDDGVSWSVVDRLRERSGGWVTKVYRVSDFVTPSSATRVRFLTSDAPDTSITEAAIDEFTAYELDCLPAASSVVRNGTGLNPLGFAETSPPVLGGQWRTTVDVATPGALASVVFVALGGPTAGGVLNGALHGELLCLPPYPADLLDVATGVHSVAVPADPTLIGLTFCTQAITFSPADMQMQNAIDITIGY